MAQLKRRAAEQGTSVSDASLRMMEATGLTAENRPPFPNVISSNAV